MVSTDNKPSTLSVWISATRPRTLPAAVAPVLVGSALAWQSGSFKPLPAALCLTFALLAQIAANFANDYFDFVKGADTAARKGPRRAVASGLVSPGAMRRAMIGVCVLAFLEGLCLIPYGGPPLLAVGLLSILFALAYTGGPYPLGYHGLGDLFVFIFFGLVAVGATAYVQEGQVTGASMIAGAAVGLLAVNILVANNYRDSDTDKVAGKKTLVVRFGRPFARFQFAAAHILAFAAVLILFAQGMRPPLAAWTPFPLLAFWASRQAHRLRSSSDPAELIALLGNCGLYLAAYAVALSLWIALS